MSLSIFSEKVQASGTFNIQVFSDLLGRPMIDRMSVFVRETAQNSWDARLGTNSDVDFSIEIGTFSATRSKKLKNEVFPFAKHAKELTENIHTYCDTGKPYVIVRDSGTIGLAGPTEANVEGSRRNFTSFIRNVGQDEGASTTSGRGGTFGFGKTVFFRVSKPLTFISYSRTVDANDKPISRIMGVSLGRITGTLYKYTGRHWWGVPPSNQELENDFNQPLTGKEADELAASIGFKQYGHKESGTSVMVIGPDFGLNSEHKLWESQEGRSKIAELIYETLGFWYWPRSMGGGEMDGKLVISVLSESKKHLLNAKEAKYPIALFADCLEALQANLKGNTEAANNLLVKVFEVRGKKQRIGLLAIAKRVYRHRESHSINLVENHPLREIIEGLQGDGSNQHTPPLCHHIALIREPGQVIRYLPTAECSQNGMEYAGVFLLAPNGQDKDEIRSSIKRSEPPSHDDWSKEEYWARLAISDISRNAAAFVAPLSSTQGGISDRAGKVSLLLSSLWSSGEGLGGLKGVDRNNLDSGDDKNSRSSGYKWDQELTLIDGKPRVLYTLYLNNKNKEGMIRCSLKAALYGGGSDELPGGTDKNFLGWYIKGDDGKLGKRISTKPILHITKDMANMVVLALVNAELDAAITATFKAD
jgi:hypothetical protein